LLLVAVVAAVPVHATRLVDTAVGSKAKPVL
jgi:hypothetical protein